MKKEKEEENDINKENHEVASAAQQPWGDYPLKVKKKYRKKENRKYVALLVISIIGAITGAIIGLASGNWGIIAPLILIGFLGPSSIYLTYKKYS